MDAYDVIIIGTGAGGGTLARHLAPVRASGSCCSSAATGCRASRQNWLAPGRLRRQPLRLAGHLVRRQGQAVPAAGPLLRRRRDEALRRGALPAAARRTSASSSHHDGISPAWPISYDELEPYYTQAEQLYQVHGARGEDPTEPPASAPYPYPAVSHEPRIQQLSRRPRGRRLPPVPRAVRDPARRGEHALQHLRALRELRRLPVRSCTRSPTPRCSACGRRSSTRTSRC